MRDGEIRDVTFFDLVLESRPLNVLAPIGDLKYLLQKIHSMSGSKAKNKTMKLYNKKKQRIYIRDIEIDANGKWAILLLYHLDSKGMGASFTNLSTYEQEDILLNEGKARAESSHVLISLTPAKNTNNRYLTLIEDLGKLNKNRIILYINYLLRSISEAHPTVFQAPKLNGAKNKDGSPKMNKYRNFINLLGHIADDFENEISKGKLLGLTLERANDTKKGLFEGVHHVAPSRQQLILKPVKKKWTARIKDILSETKKLGKDNEYYRMKINFRSADGKPHTVTMATEDNSTVGDTFLKKARLSDFKAPLNEADIAINPEMKDKMIKKLNSI